MLTLKTLCYGYPMKEWDFDVSKLLAEPSKQITPETCQASRFDFCDLSIIKELSPRIETIELARQLKQNVSDIAYHLNQRVFERKLVKCFKLYLEGTSEKGWLKRRIVYQVYIFNGIFCERDEENLISIFTSMPFACFYMIAEGRSYLRRSYFRSLNLTKRRNIFQSSLEQMTWNLRWSCRMTAHVWVCL